MPIRNRAGENGGMKPLLAIAALCALAVGCMGPSQEEYYWAHFGPYPTNYHDTISAWVDKNFDTPRSVYISSPVRARVPKRLLEADGKVYAWCAGVSLEEKGVFDRYTPRKHFHIYLREGGIVTASIKTPEQTGVEGLVQTQSP
jgi:hypothetical protein